MQRAAAAAAARKAESARKQQSLHDQWRSCSRREVDEQWARAFYSCGISFSVADNLEFRKAVQLTSQYLQPKALQGVDKPMYANPNRRSLGGALLISTDVAIQKQVVEMISPDLPKFGASYVGDGCSSLPGSRPLINGLLETPTGARFINATDGWVRRRRRSSY